MSGGDDLSLLEAGQTPILMQRTAKATKSKRLQMKHHTLAALATLVSRRSCFTLAVRSVYESTTSVFVASFSRIRSGFHMLLLYFISSCFACERGALPYTSSLMSGPSVRWLTHNNANALVSVRWCEVLRSRMSCVGVLVTVSGMCSACVSRLFRFM